MMLKKNRKAMIRSSHRDTKFFDTDAAVLQGSILAPYFLKLSVNYVFRTFIDLIKENGFISKMARNR